MPEKKVFIIMWDAETAQTHAEALEAAGWQVAVESGDVESAISRIKADLPFHVVISLANDPAKSILAARAIRADNVLGEIRVFYVDIGSAKQDLLDNVRAAYMVNWGIMVEELESSLRRAS